MKLIICKGLPGAGKSFWSKNWVNQNPKERVRVCRDDIRRMLGPYWVPQREDLVTDIENACIAEALTNGYSVVVDATNLRGSQRFEDFVGINNESDDIELIVKDFTHVPIETCIERDKNRPEEEQVGEKIIRKMAVIYSLS